MLVPLQSHHGDALEAFLVQFDDTPKDLHGYFVERKASVDEAVRLLDAWAHGDELNDGWVPCTTRFWKSGDDLAGIVNIRHELSDGLRKLGGHIGYSVAPSHRRQGVATAMLAGALDICRDLGIDRALLTVDTDNIGSRKVIEANGGVLEREAVLEQTGALQRWYWIDLA